MDLGILGSVPAETSGGPSPRASSAARHGFAWTSALFSAGVVVAQPGEVVGDDADWFGLLIVLGPAAAAMAMPFLLVGALLRVPVVWVSFGLLMVGVTAWTGIDLLREGGDGASLLAFALIFATNTILVLVAVAVDLLARAVLRRRATPPTSVR